MKVYNYNGKTGAYISTVDAKVNPLEPQSYLCPANATFTPPPSVSSGSIAIYNGSSWESKEDHVGKVAYSTATAQPSVIDKYGPLQDGLTELSPETFSFPVWVNGVWAEDQNLLRAKALEDKILEIDEYKANRQSANFTYNGVEFYSDDDTFAKTRHRCDSLSGTDPVPTPTPIAGNWKSAEFNEDGSPKLIQMTVADFKAFCDFRYDQSAVYWGAAQVHKGNIESMAASGATAEQITNYDHTIGWE